MRLRTTQRIILDYRDKINLRLAGAIAKETSDDRDEDDDEEEEAEEYEWKDECEP